MKYIVVLLFLLSSIISQNFKRNFFSISGKESSTARGDKSFRSIFKITIPKSHTGDAYLRIFDADGAGLYDSGTNLSVRYRVVKSSDLPNGYESIDTSLDSVQTFIDKTISEDITYNNQWRSLGKLPKGESFHLLIDGVSGNGSNLYSLFLSSQEKQNIEIGNIKITAPKLTIRPVSRRGFVSELKFFVPNESSKLFVSVFDADAGQRVYFESLTRQGIKIKTAVNKNESVTEIVLDNNEKNKLASVIITESRIDYENMQISIKDDKGNSVPFILPAIEAKRNNLPNPVIATLPVSECTSLLLNGSNSTDPDQDLLRYLWYVDGTFVGEGSHLSHNFGQAGSYDLTLKVVDNSPFVVNSKTISQKVKINHPPEAVITSEDIISVDDRITFDGSGSKDIDGSIEFYYWDFGDGNRANGKKVTHKYQYPGKYNVILTVKDNGSSVCNKHEVVKTVWVNTRPVAAIGSIPKAAIDEPIAFDGSKSIDSDGEIVSYVWDLGDGATGNGKTISHKYSASGFYTVTLKVSDNAYVSNSAHTVKRRIFINEPPEPIFTVPKIVAVNDIVSLNASKSIDKDGQITAFEWVVEGLAKTGENNSHIFKTPGNYAVTLKITDNSGTNNKSTSLTNYIRVNSPPVPNAGLDRISNSSIVEFDASGSADSDDEIINYFWNFGDGTSGTGKKVQHIYRSEGDYIVKLTVTDASNTKSAKQATSINIRVNHAPVADAGRSQVVAVDQTFNLDGSLSKDLDGTISAYEWLINGKTKTGSKVTHSFNEPGKYDVQLKVSDNDNAVDYHTTQIIVNSAPIPRINFTKRVAPAEKVRFDADLSYDIDGKIRTYIWDFGDGSKVKRGSNVTYSYKSSGRYIVKLSIEDDAAVSNSMQSVSKLIEVNYAPQAYASPNVLTSSQNVLFDASKSYDTDKDKLSYTWNFGDGTTVKGLKQQHIYKNAGIYPVTLIVNDGTGLSNSISKYHYKVRINSIPQAIIDAPKTACAGEQVIFDGSRSKDADNDLLKYHWDFGDGNTSNIANPFHRYTRSGYFPVRLTVTDNSNAEENFSTSEVLLKVVAAPVAKAGPDITVCANTVVQFDGSKSDGGDQPIKSYSWDFGNGKTGGGTNPTNVFEKEGTYIVNLTVTVDSEGSCVTTSSDELVVKVIPAPVATFEVKPEACIGEELVFDASKSHAGSQKIDSYTWDFGNGEHSTSKIAKYAFKKAGEYTVTLRVNTVSNEECNSSEITRKIKINASPIASFVIDEIGVKEKNQSEFLPFKRIRFNAKGSEDQDGAIKSYVWDFGDGEKALGLISSHQYSKPGKYIVKLEITDNSLTICNTSVFTKEVVIRGDREIELKHSSFYMLSEKATFTSNINDTTNQWVFSDGVKHIGSTAERSFEKAGNYHVQLIKDHQVKTASFTVVDFPEAKLRKNYKLIEGESFSLNPFENEISKLFKVLWKKDGNVISTNQKLILNDVPMGTHEYILEITSNLSKSIKTQLYSVTVKVDPLPSFGIKSDSGELFSGGARDEATFRIISENKDRFTYEWSFGDGTKAFGQEVKHRFKSAGNYAIRVIGTLKNSNTIKKVNKMIKVSVKER